MHLFSRILANSLVASSIIGIASGVAVPANRTHAPTVTIASGVVVGTTKTPSNQPSSTAFANAYQGIPFADSPPERFSPPQRPKPWKAPLQAQNMKPACTQQFIGGGYFQSFLKMLFNNPLRTPPEESEDCLYLNVYAPADASPTNRKAVLFWIYGGNLQFGTASMEYYDGTSFAVNSDVVVVTINYRTNIFGYSNSPEIPFGQQNAGHLDQRLALSWVQENIAQFGGDPAKVTIFGESAGGYSVKQLMANPPSPLPFRAAIMQSEASLLLGNGTEHYQMVLERFSCSDAPSPINCLRKVPAADIKQYIESNVIMFPPVDGDGTQVSSVKDLISNKKFADVPFFLGTNSDEGRAFVAATGTNNGTAAVDAVLNLISPHDKKLQQNIIAQYTADIVEDEFLLASRKGNLTQPTRIVTDAIFTCPASHLTNSAAANGYRVWRYLYSSAFPNTHAFKNAGVYHSSEIPEVFGTYPLKTRFGDVTPQQIRLSRVMQSAWAGFAKHPEVGPGWAGVGSGSSGDSDGGNGNGNGNGNGTSGLQQFGADGSDRGRLVPLRVADYPCAAYEPVLGLTGY